ncbi:hypothetical protein KCU61_g6, partial [Aureobasidium melanogenum]
MSNGIGDSNFLSLSPHDFYAFHPLFSHPVSAPILRHAIPDGPMGGTCIGLSLRLCKVRASFFCANYGVRPRRVKIAASFQGTLRRWPSSTLCNANYAQLCFILRVDALVTADIYTRKTSKRSRNPKPRYDTQLHPSWVFSRADLQSSPIHPQRNSHA